MLAAIKYGLQLSLGLWISAGAVGYAQAPNRSCRSLIDKGDRASAIAVCKQASRATGKPEEMIDVVQALLMGQGPLPPQDLYDAAVMARAAARWGDLYGAMARCHLGKRLGDEMMLTMCTKTLAEKYSHLPQALAVLESVKPPRPWKLLLSWLVVLFAVGGTALHAFLHRARRAGAPAVAAAAVFVCALASLWPAMAHAQQDKPIDIDLPNRFPINDANPRASVPTPEQRERFPVDFGYFLQEALDLAERATNENRHADAAKYYFAVAAAVPDVAVGFTKLCDSLEKAGQIKEAIVACKGATTRDGAKVSDHVNLVRLILSQSDPIDSAQMEDVAATVGHLKAEADKKNLKDAKIVAYDLECDLAKRTNNKALLAECAQALAQLSPNTARSLSLQWAVAMQNNDKATAQRLAGLAEQQNMAPDVVSKMKEGADTLVPAWRRAVADWRVLLVALLAGLVGAFVALRKRAPYRQGMAS